MGDKIALERRVKELRINPDAIEEVRVQVPGAEMPFVIPNAEGKRNSLQIWANATDRNGEASSSSAKDGLKTYDDYVPEALAKPEDHPAVIHMKNLADSGKKWRVDVVRRDDSKKIPDYIRQAISDLKGTHDTFYTLDGPGIRGSMQEFNEAFAWTNFTNFFAVKALPYYEILKLLNPLGSGLDCSSAGELHLGELAGYNGERKIFTSNNTRLRDFKLARDLDSLINLDDITFIEKLEKAVGRDRFPDALCFRWNPGPLREGSDIIGDPEETKYGLTNEQLPEAYRMAKEKGSHTGVRHCEPRPIKRRQNNHSR